MFWCLPDQTMDAFRFDWWKSDCLYGLLHPEVGELENYSHRFREFYLLVCIAEERLALHDDRHGYLVDATKLDRYSRFGDFWVIVQYLRDSFVLYIDWFAPWWSVGTDFLGVQFAWPLPQFTFHFHKSAQYRYDDIQFLVPELPNQLRDRLEFDRFRIRWMGCSWEV